MKIKKLYNNNILLVEDEKLYECILLGKGIGFNKKVGEDVDQSKIDKKFVLESKELTNKFIELLRDIPVNHLELTNRIVEAAQKRLDVLFNDSIYIGLTDHINYAIHRYRQGESLSNALLWEVKKFYHKEFEAALESLKIIEYYENIKLSEDEASFIALHFVNGQQGGEQMKLTATATAIIQDILNIVKYHFNIKINEKSLNYTRFITHIQFFIRRLSSRELCSNDDEYLFLQIKEKYPEVYACTLKVKKYLEQKFDVVLSSEEMLYFMLHINRVTERENTS